MIYQFTIFGNHKDPKGNPMPKVKLMGKQQWTPRAQQYVLWKKHVVACFLNSISFEKRSVYLKNYAVWHKPIILEKMQKAKMDLDIRWHNETHADPESVFGSIADALFENDKHLDGTFYARHIDADNISGRVDVRLII